MGYMNLTIIGSDLAAGAVDQITEKMGKMLLKAVKEKANDYNTSGPVNVGMFFHELIEPAVEAWAKIAHRSMFEAAEKALEGLEAERKETRNKNTWTDEGNRLEHREAYSTFIKAIRKFLALG